MQDNVRRKCIFHPYLTIQCHHHVGHQNSSHDHASPDFYFEEEPVVVGDAPRQHVGPFVSVIYWTYHIKQVLNYEIRQQGKASDHSTFSCECQENVLACIAWQFCWEHYWARSCKMHAKCVQMSGKALRLLCPHPPLLLCTLNQNCHAMQAKNVQKPCAQPGCTNP